MYYTIGLFEKPGNNLKIDINVSGNKYTVGIWDIEKHESTTKTFDSLIEAYKVFEKLVSWCVFGYYSDESKKQFLKTGTMM